MSWDTLVTNSTFIRSLRVCSSTARAMPCWMSPSSSMERRRSPSSGRGREDVRLPSFTALICSVREPRSPQSLRSRAEYRTVAIKRREGGSKNSHTTSRRREPKER